ncbi:hypothetical protein [Evansella cellulosilytica]|uniref:hypothetical protein n=1 Tax=Evansella cellulosilytica TaxID=1413 RepID=UPI0001C26D56
MTYDYIPFKNYNIEQLYLPMDLEVHIPENHVCRTVHEAVEQINTNFLLHL